MRHGTIVFVEIPVRNLERAADFYAGIFGWSFEEDERNPRRWLFTPGGRGAMGAITTARAVVPGVRICVAVDSVVFASNVAIELGGGVCGDTPQSEIGKPAELVDPDGNHLWIFEGKLSRAGGVPRSGDNLQ